MKIFIIYWLATVIVAILISLAYYIFAERLTQRGWEKPNWYTLLINIALAPITVPWWIVCFVRANKKVK